jgi:hypothetical protein
MVLDESYILAINIPGWDVGFSNCNLGYFDFSKHIPNCLRSHSAPLQVSLIIASFISAFIFREGPIRFILFFITLLFCLWYTIGSRYMRIYMRLMRNYTFTQFKSATRNLNKLINNQRIFTQDMPIIYFILKSKALLKKGDFLAADFLANRTLERHSSCAEALYIKTLCYYLKKESNKFNEYERILAENHPDSLYLNYLHKLKQT